MKISSTTPRGLKFAIFSDGNDEGLRNKDVDRSKYTRDLQKGASDTLRDVIHKSADQGRPVSCLVYTLLLPWASELARECHVHRALLWIQPAIVLDSYYYYFNGYEDDIKNMGSHPDSCIQLPRLPLLKSSDLPSFMLGSCPEEFHFVLTAFKEQLDILDQEVKPKVLVNTFDALESEWLTCIDNYNVLAVGPLIPSAFLDGKDALDTSYCGDLFDKSKDYMGWLSSKPAASVVYVSFGSLLTLPKQQMEEIARGLLESGKPFLWVIKEEEFEKEEEKLRCMEELEQKGMVVPWCSQLEVLAHPSLACFVTHCGWNSTLESLCCGIPQVAFPRWTDQGTNAKLIQDVWRTGVRVIPREDGLVESDELKRCIGLVMEDGEKGVDLRNNAKKWKDLARETMLEGGSSTIDLERFIIEVGKPF